MRNIGFDRILVMLTTSFSETDQQQHSYTIAILSISPSQITPIRRFSVHSPLEIVDLICTQSWIFALKETGSVEVWTLDGFRKGLVDVNSYCAIQAPGSCMFFT
jgi:alpha-tubulin suppressor-like RCC1 family protein